MTKHLRYLFAALLVWICTVGGYAQNEKTVTLTLSDKAKFGTASGSTLTQDGVKWTVTSTSGAIQNAFQTSYKGQQFGTSKAVWKGYFSTSDIAGTIKSIDVAANTGGSATLSVKVGDSDFTCNSSTSVSVVKNSTDINTYSFIGNSSGKIVVSLNGTSKACYLGSIKVTYTDGSSSLTSTTTSFGDNSKKTFNFVKGVLDGFTAPVATAKAGDTDITSQLQYSSSAPDIVTVASDGTLTFTNTKFGEAEIKAEIVKGDTYDTSSDTYTVVNSEPAKTATSLSFGSDKDNTIVALIEGLLSDGSDFTGYTATESTGVAGTISYAATGDNVATVDAATGALTINKTTYGTTTITATFTPTDAETYAASTATYKITNEKKVDDSTIVFSSDDKSFAKISNLSGSGYKSGNVDFVASNGKSYTFTCNRVLLDNDRLQINKSTVTSPNFDNLTDGYNLTVTYASKSGNIKLSSGSSNVTGTSTGNASTYKSITLNVSDGSNFVIQETKSNALYIKSIEIVKSTPKTDPALSFANPAQEVELKEGLVDIQTLTKPTDLAADAITYVSSDNTIAEVTEGLITLKKTGEVTIKATSAATDIYSASTAEYTLKVVDNRAEAPVSVKEESVNAELYVGLYDPADNINNTNNLKLTYASSNADIALNEVGYLAYNKIGSSTITISFAGNDDYKPFETAFTLNVVDTRAEAPISFKEQTVTVKLPTEEYHASTNVTNEQNLALTYAVDNEEEFDVEDDLVVFAKVGSTTIIVSYAGSETYKPFTGSFTLNVEESRKEDAAFKFDAESYDIDLADEAYVDATFDANAKLQNPNSLTYTWTISPTTNGEGIDANGKVTGLKRGTYTITATSQTDNSYLATTATCQLVVENSAVKEQTVEFVAGTDKGEKSGADPDQMQKSFVSIVSGRAAFGRGDNYRFYQTYTDASGNTQIGETTISTKIGNITKIEFVGSGNATDKYGLNKLSTEDNKYSAADPNYGVWKGFAKSVTFTASATAYATNIIVTLELPKAKAYTFSDDASTIALEDYDNANVTINRKLEADGGWWTLCLPFTLDADQMKTYFGDGAQLRTFDSMNGTTMNFKTATELEAGKPYLVKPTTTFDGTTTKFECVQLKADDPEKQGTGYAMIGTYHTETLATNGTDLFLGANNKFYKPSEGGNTIKGFRVYFQCPADKVGVPMTANIDGVETAITRIDGEQLGSTTDTRVYNLQGQCVGTTLRGLASGIYVCGGRKVVVK